MSCSTKRATLLLVVCLILGVSALDPNCNVYNSDGSCQVCSFRFYHNAATGYCTQVSDQCATWSTSTGDCLSCYGGYSLSSGDCIIGDISVGQPSPVVDQFCQCYNDDRTCKACYAGYTLGSDGLCTVIVSTPVDDHCAEYGWISKKNLWFKKPTNGCKKVCKACDNGYYLDKNNVCQQNPDNCAVANTDGSCKTCIEGYQLNDQGVCDIIVSTPVDPCTKYGYVNSQSKWGEKWFFGCKKVCLSCSSGYYLDNKYICQQNPENCQVANADGTCHTCDDGYAVDTDGSCVVIVTLPTDHCVEWGYVDSKGFWGSVWFHSCKKVCKVCDSGYYLDSKYKCQQNPSNCVTANADGTCKVCADGYALDTDGTCNIIVSLPTDHCTQWGYGDLKGKWNNDWFKGCKKICQACESGYYLDTNYKCQPNPANCVVVNSDGSCKTCADGYALDVTDGDCEIIVSLPTDHCTQWGYGDLKGKWNNDWFRGCKKVCKACESGYYLDKTYKCQPNPAHCTVANADGTCKTCDTGFTLNTDGTCSVTVSTPTDTCAVYGYVDSKGKWFSKWNSGCKKVCKQCITGYTLQADGTCDVTVSSPAEDCDLSLCQTFGSDGKSCGTCSYRSYLDENNCCIVVNGYCNGWLSDGTCTSCYSGYYINPANKRECLRVGA